jgi:glycosyltransferase involved in cell wall biosynthesis
MAKNGVTVVAPVYNNAATLQELCARVRHALADRPLQIVLVDDRSTDRSLQVMEGLAVTTIAHSHNRGQNAAIVSGLAAAAHPLACVIDADLEDPPESIPLLLASVEAAEVQVAFASRDEARRPTSRLFRWTLRRLFPSLPGHACLCFAIDAAGREALVRAARDGDYLPALIGWLELPARQVAITRGPRPDRAGASANGGLRRTRYAAAALRAAFRLRWRRRRSRSASTAA